MDYALLVDVGTQALPVWQVVLAVLGYAAAALLIQTGVVVAYALTPHAQRHRAMAAFVDRLARRGELWAGIVSLLLGVGLPVFTGPDLLAALLS